MGNVLKKYNSTISKWEAVGGTITGDTLPIGTIVPYGNYNAPIGWLNCNGQAVSRTTYADLFAIIGTQFGEGDGSTTFNVPDLNQYRVPIGYDRFEEQSDRMNLGTVGGEENHTMTIEELVSHNHTVDRCWGGSSVEDLYGKIQAGYSDASYWNKGVTSNTGNSKPFNVMQPYVTTNYIIKAFQSTGVIANVAQTKTKSNIDTYSCNYLNSLQGKLLWTNPNGYANQEFASQALTFEDNYDHYDIIYAQDGVSLKCDRVYVNANVAYILQSNLGGYIRTRGVAAYGNSMLFDNGYFYSAYASGTVNNNQCVPYKIIGYK